MAQTELAQRNAELRQQQLVAEVVKPAEAEAERVRITAAAEAERMRVQAEAAASYDRVALDRMIIDQLPLIVEKAAAGLNGANINVLNGADGLSEIAAGLVGQGLAILDSVKKGIADEDGEQADQAARGSRQAAGDRAGADREREVAGSGRAARPHISPLPDIGGPADVGASARGADAAADRVGTRVRTAGPTGFWSV